MEGKDQPRVMGKKEFEEKGATDGLMVMTTNQLWGTGKVVVMDSRFCVLEGLISMVEKGVFGSELIKKRRYWPKGVPNRGDSLAHAKQGGWGCGSSSNFNKRKDL